MNDNNYFTTINEIEGEIASLKVTLKMTNDPKRKQELDRDIKNLEEQLAYLKDKMKNKDNFEKNEEGSSTKRENYSNNNIEEDYYNFDRNYDDEER